jgi:hypothetical protein
MMPNNLLQVDLLIDNFIKDHITGISTIHRLHYKTDNQLSFQSLLEELKEPLTTGCITFLNKQYPMEEINSYLFYIVNDYCKRNSVFKIKVKKQYICPGCFFLDKESILQEKHQAFECGNCKEELKNNTDPKNILFFKTFAKHSKKGFRCQDCNQFIPQPFEILTIISCPYLNCCFVGELSSLKKMYHPSINFNPEKMTLDENKNGKITKNLIPSNEIDIQTKLEIKESIKNQYHLLADIINSQANNIPYQSHDYTIIHKSSIYQAFNNLLQLYPQDFINYLLHNSRSGGFQHKLFQEYIKILENKLPFDYKKGNINYTVSSLLDVNLSLFEGISVFESAITDKLTIKNETKEFYIGGRDAYITKPYYIGKLLNIVDKKTKETLINQVVEYSFSLIKLKEAKPGTKVIVSHLRVPPHYQMGAMANLNRIRKKIIEKYNSINTI